MRAHRAPGAHVTTARGALNLTDSINTTKRVVKVLKELYSFMKLYSHCQACYPFITEVNISQLTLIIVQRHNEDLRKRLII